LVGAFCLYIGYLITLKQNIIIYDAKYPEGILSQMGREEIGSDVALIGIMSFSIGLTELLIPEFDGRLFYFLAGGIFLVALMMELADKPQKRDDNNA
jgi:hypothetical protein